MGWGPPVLAGVLCACRCVLWQRGIDGMQCCPSVTSLSPKCQTSVFSLGCSRVGVLMGILLSLFLWQSFSHRPHPFGLYVGQETELQWAQSAGGVLHGVLKGWGHIQGWGSRGGSAPWMPTSHRSPPWGGGVSTGVGMPAEGNRALLSGQTKPRCVPQCPALCQAVLWQGLAVPGAGNTAGLGVPRASHSAPSALQKPDLQGC